MWRGLILGIIAVILPALGGESKTRVDYPGVAIDLEKKEVRIAAKLSDNLGWKYPVIEFILFRGKLKDYETLFITTAEPMHIHLGLLLIGLRPKVLPEIMVNSAAKPADYPPDMPPILHMSVEWKHEGKTITQPLSFFLRARKDNRQPDMMDFAYTGSNFSKDSNGDNVLSAALTGEIATLIYNPEALINLTYNEPSPYNSQSSGFCVNVSQLPKEFTRKVTTEDYSNGEVTRNYTASKDVTIIITPAK